MIQVGKFYIVMDEKSVLYTEVVEITDVCENEYQYVSLRNNKGTFKRDHPLKLIAVDDIKKSSDEDFYFTIINDLLLS